MARASCLCGDVAWEAAGPFEFMTHCHCSMCRKAHGASFATYLAAPEAGFRWLRGEERITRYESSPGFHRPFCARCGSVVAGDAEEGRVFMPAGCLDDDPGKRPQAHIFVASKAPWVEIRDSLPRFDAYPPGMGAEVARAPMRPAGEGGIQGSCLCGGVAFEVEGHHELMLHCHCSRCRKARGAAFATNLFVPSQALRWLRGEERVRRFQPPAAKRFANHFCEVCGGIAPRAPADGGAACIAVGSLDTDPGTRPKLHIYVASKAPWFEIDDDLPRFAEAPPERG